MKEPDGRGTTVSVEPSIWTANDRHRAVPRRAV